MNHDADQDTMDRTTDTMARSTERTRQATHPIDDDDIARIVRDVAAGWVMPPVRLDQPGWRQRVRSPRGRRANGVKGWFGRLGQAATGAVVLTVAAALVAVYLTGPAFGPGKPGESSRPTPGASQDAAASQLPKLVTSGDLPSPSRVAVQTEMGQFAIADLSTGTVGSQLTAGSWGSQLRQAPNGDFVCFCTTTDGTAYGAYTHITVSFDRFDPTGKVSSRAQVLDVTGSPDPRYGQVPQQPGHVSAAITFSADGRYAYVGWAAREHPVWKSGIVVVALDDGSIVQRLDLPSRDDGTGDTGVYVDAPRVAGQAGAQVVINRSFYTWSPVLAVDASYTPGADVYTAAGSTGSLAKPVELEAAGSCGDQITLAGSLADGGMWLSCVHAEQSVTTTIRRLHADGSRAGDTVVSFAYVDGSTSALSPDGTFLYVWDAIGLELNRIELATGNTTKARAPAPAAASNPLTALGRWIAPATLAKMLLQPGIAISPDGGRAFAIGIVGGQSGYDLSGSAGIVVFDTASMTVLGRWRPTADFVSVAVSADGSFVYAAGATQVDASGDQTDQQASITVFNAGDGSVRLLAGQLGRRLLTFTSPTLR
jgi:hypothetical protein